MSDFRLSHTCELNEVNPFDYLIQQHADSVSKAPDQWLPWNYSKRLEPIDTG
jgi:hypothetical protein